MVFLEKNRIVHGDLHANNIFVDNNGFVKLADNGFLSPYKNCFTKTILDNEVRFLAPELLEKVCRKDYNAAYTWKHDIFTLGMTLLYVASLTDLSSCYEGNQINLKLLNSIIGQLREIYSSTFIDTIVKMLHFNPNERISWVELNQILEKFRPKKGFGVETQGLQQNQAAQYSAQQSTFYSGQQGHLQPAQPIQQSSVPSNMNYYVNSNENQEPPMIYKSNYIPPNTHTYQNYQAETSGYLNNEQLSQQISQVPSNIKLSSYIPPQNLANYSLAPQGQYQVNPQYNVNPNKAPFQNQVRVLEGAQLKLNEQQARAFEQQRTAEQVYGQQRIIEKPKIIEQQQRFIEQPRVLEQQRFIEQPRALEQQRFMEQQRFIEQAQMGVIEQQPPMQMRVVEQQPQMQMRVVEQQPQMRVIEKQPQLRIVEQQPQMRVVEQQQVRFIEQPESYGNINYIQQQQTIPTQGLYTSALYNQNPSYFSNDNQISMTQAHNYESYGQQQNLEENYGNKGGQEVWNNGGNDLDKRIQDALKASEETLMRNQEYLQRANANGND